MSYIYIDLCLCIVVFGCLPSCCRKEQSKVGNAKAALARTCGVPRAAVQEIEPESEVRLARHGNVARQKEEVERVLAVSVLWAGLPLTHKEKQQRQGRQRGDSSVEAADPDSGEGCGSATGPDS